MTETIDPMDSSRIDTHQFAQALVEQARSEGVELVGPGGLLTGLTKTVLETALEAEISDHLGYDKYDAAGRNGENSRNGTRSKTVFTPDRAGADRGAAGSRRHVRTVDSEEAAAAVGRYRLSS